MCVTYEGLFVELLGPGEKRGREKGEGGRGKGGRERGNHLVIGDGFSFLFLFFLLHRSTSRPLFSFHCSP